MTALIYAFNRFGDLTFNPVERLVTAWAEQLGVGVNTGSEADVNANSQNVVFELLETDYASAGDRLCQRIEQLRPSLVLGMGVAVSRERLSLERFALNMDDAALPDNSGCVRQGELIDKDGPMALLSSADLSALLSALVSRSVAAEISNHAGNYLCNHTYYRALRCLQTLSSNAPCVFVHVPMTRELAIDAAELPSGGLDIASSAGQLAALQWVLAQLKEQSAT